MTHAAAPHLRKRWTCTACGVSMMAFYHEIDKHRATCGLSSAEHDPAALPSGFGRDGRKGPSLQVRRIQGFHWSCGQEFRD